MSRLSDAGNHQSPFSLAAPSGTFACFYDAIVRDNANRWLVASNARLRRMPVPPRSVSDIQLTFGWHEAEILVRSREFVPFLFTAQ
jgi:hypothetical protein